MDIKFYCVNLHDYIVLYRFVLLNIHTFFNALKNAKRLHVFFKLSLFHKRKVKNTRKLRSFSLDIDIPTEKQFYSIILFILYLNTFTELILGLFLTIPLVISMLYLKFIDNRDFQIYIFLFSP